MDSYIIKGQNRLNGELNIHGAKNAALPILAACVLVKGTVKLTNVPIISDTIITIEILRHLGANVSIDGSTAFIDCSQITDNHVPEFLAKKMRSSIIFMGALLARTGSVNISMPGGCKLGQRPIDLHLNGLKALGAEIKQENGNISCISNSLKGARINLTFPSVGATQNIMLAAVYAKGTTIIENAAKEPEIIDMAKMLNLCGAKITIGQNITIEGVETLRSAAHKIMGDRIVAGTYLAAAAITRGQVYLKGVEKAAMMPIIEAFKKCGMYITADEDIIYARATKLNSTIVTTDPHPGFPTDMQPQIMAVLSTVAGTSIIEEKVFEARSKHVKELNKMDAAIFETTSKRNTGIFTITGERLKGEMVKAQDLRGGAALILAGLAAHGTTIVQGAEYVKRGYHSIEQDLKSLGADIQYLPPQDIIYADTGTGV